MNCKSISARVWIGILIAPVVFGIGLPRVAIGEEHKVGTDKEYVKIRLKGEITFGYVLLYDQAKTGLPLDLTASVQANGITWHLDMDQSKLQALWSTLKTTKVVVTGSLDAEALQKWNNVASPDGVRLPLAVSEIQASCETENRSRR